MVRGEGKVGLAAPSSSGDSIFGPEAGRFDIADGKSVPLLTAGTNSQIPQAVYVRYRDHVFFRNVQTPIAKAVIREALGWVKKEDDEVMLIECDRPLLQGYNGFNGVVVLKSCIVSMVEVPLQSFSSWDLNCTAAKKKSEYCALAKEAKNSAPKKSRKEQKSID